MIVSVIYPKSAGSHFDHSYYMNSHIPLVQRLWGKYKLSRAEVLRGTGSLGGDAPYELICLLEFPDRETFLQAAGAHSDEIMGDVPKFTNIQPLVQFNEVAS